VHTYTQHKGILQTPDCLKSNSKKTLLPKNMYSFPGVQGDQSLLERMAGGGSQAVLPYQHKSSSAGLLPLLFTFCPFRTVSLLEAWEKPQTHYSHEFLCHTRGYRLQERNSKMQ